MKRNITLISLLFCLNFSAHAQFCDEPIGFGKDASICGDAQNYTVSNLNDAGPGSLREALENTTSLKINFSVSGTITLSADINIYSNCKYVDGVGQNITIANFGFKVQQVENIIIRNLSFRSNGNDNGGNGDAISIEKSAKYIWIDHCTFSKYFDGLVDVKRESDFITVSWCRFYDHNKTMLIGHDDAHTADIGKLNVTLHHNLFDGTVQRHPRLRFGKVHMMNNYLRNIQSYATGACLGGEVYIENNIYENVGTTSQYCAGNNGIMTAVGNYRINSGNFLTNGNAFNPAASYNYQADVANDQLKAILGAYAGANTTNNLNITQSGNFLNAPIANSYQWLLNGNIISGANAQTYKAKEKGNYTIQLTGDNGCIKEVQFNVSALEPEGFLEQSDCGIISGYGHDPDSTNLSIDAHIYVDGNFVAIAKTEYFKKGYNFNHGINGSHYFIWQVPAQFKDSATHLVEVYLINYPSGSGNNVKIGTANIGPCNSGEPIGHYESAWCNKISGWAFDPDDTTQALVMHLYVDGNMEASIDADLPRSDVNTDQGISGNHGFEWMIPNKYKDGNTHLYELYMLNYPYGSGLNNPKLLHRNISPCEMNSPFGSIDSITCDKITGWIVDLDDLNDVVIFHVFIDGVLQSPGYVNKLRNDINTLYSITGNHGFEWDIPIDFIDGKEHTISIYALNVPSTPGSNPEIGEQKINCSPLNGVQHIRPDEVISLTCYPNPSSRELNISFDVKSLSQTTLSMIDLLGRENILLDKVMSGNQTINLDLEKMNLSAGSYFIKLATEDEIKIQKVLLSK